MAVCIDLAQRQVSASVGDLVGEHQQRIIGLAGSGLSRLWIGQELHRSVQEQLRSQEPEIETEVPTQLTVSVGEWQVRVNGRADAVAYDGEVPVRVDEIKTLHFAVELGTLFARERLEPFFKQAQLYAFMLSHQGAPAAARLLLVDIVTSEIRVEEVKWSPESVAAWLRQQVYRLVGAEKKRLQRLEALRLAADTLVFPHQTLRPSQDQISDAVYDSLTAGHHLLLRAPTGCGKTAAVMFPALRAALAGGYRLFFLTAKTLQQKIAVETAKAMQQHGQFRSIQLRAKRKMCANKEMICHEECCRYAQDYSAKLARTQLVEHLLASAPHLDPDRIFSVAKEHEVCPFEVSLDLLREVNLVVCDYNYVFDPSIGLAAVLDQHALSRAVLVIDEAHNLLDRSRGYFSPVLDAQLIERTGGLLSMSDSDLFSELRELVGRTKDLIQTQVDDALQGARHGQAQACFPLDEVAQLRMDFDGAMLQYFVYKREHELWLTEDPVLELFFTLTHFHRTLALGGEEFYHLASREQDGAQSIKILCLDAAKFVGAALEESVGTVAMSATLEPFEFYQTLLGFDPHRTDRLHVPSPFPAENRLVISIDDVDTTYRRRSAYYDAIAHKIARLAPRGRNSLILFPSYRFLQAVSDRLPPVPHIVLAQAQGSTDQEQEELLSALASGTPHLVLAVLGGIFAEGVDYPGDMLSQVIVVSPGLPQFNLERELLKAYYQQHHEHAFSYAYLIPGMTRVVQAAGRLIRSDQDRGVIVLICRRFQDPRYARLLPEEWTQGDAATLLRGDPEGEIKTFFSDLTSDCE